MRILGVRLDPVTKEEALAAIEARLLEPGDGPFVISTLNSECLALASRDSAYREVLNRSSLNLADGVGVVWAARLRGTGPIERIAGSNLIYDLAELCRVHDKRLFLLGSAPATVNAALQRLRGLYRGLIVNGYAPPALTSHRLPPQEERAVFQKLAAASPQVLCVALGMPRQELWIAEYRDRLGEAGVSVAIGVGGAIDYLAGVLPRAPQSVQRLGLEWLYRLWHQPRKRLRRQAGRLPRFLLLASLESLRLRLRGGSG